MSAVMARVRPHAVLADAILDVAAILRAEGNSEAEISRVSVAELTEVAGRLMATVANSRSDLEMALLRHCTEVNRVAYREFYKGPPRPKRRPNRPSRRGLRR
ncbi:MAG: hypothetical protein ROR55_19725 [Devosia sp.]